jgi:hypothetical protein
MVAVYNGYFTQAHLDQRGLEIPSTTAVAERWSSDSFVSSMTAIQTPPRL